MASLTIAGDARIARAAHRDAFPYRLTFGRTPVRRGALRVARSGPIRYFSACARGRRSLPYWLTIKISAQPAKNPFARGEIRPPRWSVAQYPI